MAVIYGTPLFLSGGGGQNLTLPPMVTNLAASTGDQTITLTWTNPVSDVLSGVLVVYNANHIPEKVSDGTKFDAGLAETVDLTGLANGTLYYIRVFPYNSKKQYQTILEGATITATPDDFPAEPTSYSEIETVYSSIEWDVPENGYYQIDAASKGGRGGNSIYAKPDNVGFFMPHSGGGGGSGGISRKSLIALNKGDKINVTVGSNGSVNVSVGDINLYLTPGADGVNADKNSHGYGGNGGTASGGDVNINGVTGSRTTSTSGDDSPAASGGITSNNFGLSVYGGTGAGVNSGRPSAGTLGSAAFVVFYRGNTNQPSPSTASVMSLTPRNASIEANWTNSGDPESVGTILVSNSDHVPAHPTDGTSVDVAEATSYTITDLPNNKPSYISLFAYNADKTKYSAAKSDVEIPKEVTWYDVQKDVKEDVAEAQENAEQAQEVVLLTRDFLPDAVALTLPEIYDEWNPDSVSYIGKDTATEDNPASIVRYNDALYRCLQSHTSQASWTPEASPSLWVLIDDPAIEWPEWKQPTGAHDAYFLGAKVSHNGKKWISQIDANTTEPGTDERYWKEYTE